MILDTQSLAPKEGGKAPHKSELLRTCLRKMQGFTLRFLEVLLDSSAPPVKLSREPNMAQLGSTVYLKPEY